MTTSMVYTVLTSSRMHPPHPLLTSLVQIHMVCVYVSLTISTQLRSCNCFVDPWPPLSTHLMTIHSHPKALYINFWLLCNGQTILQHKQMQLASHTISKNAYTCAQKVHTTRTWIVHHLSREATCEVIQVYCIVLACRFCGLSCVSIDTHIINVDYYWLPSSLMLKRLKN